MYTFRYLNRQIFTNSVAYTLLLEDVDTKQIFRIEKAFKVDFNIIDDEFLRAEAMIEIDKLKEQLAYVEPMPEVSPDEALSDG